MAASTTKKGYEPADVRWESIAENQRNKRSNVYIDAADVRNLLTALEQGERVVWTDAERYLRPAADAADELERRSLALARSHNGNTQQR